MNDLEDAFRAAGGTIEHLVRSIVRDELRRHLGPEADHFLNVKDAPMKARKLRSLIRAGDLRGCKHGRDLFVAASDLRAFIQGRPVERPRPIAVPEPSQDESTTSRANYASSWASHPPTRLNVAPSKRGLPNGGPRAVNVLRPFERPRSGAVSRMNV